MKKKWIKNIIVIIIILIGLTSVAMNTIEPRENLTIVEEGLRIVASPFQYGLSVVSNNVKEFVSFFADKEKLSIENSNLRREIGILNNQLNQLKDASLENIRLKEMLDYQVEQQENFDLQLAKIIAKNNNNLQYVVTLDQGYNDGVTTGMAVINQFGLVGRVTVVLPNTCEVLLLVDRESAAGARVWESRETPGVVEGKGADSQMLQMIHMPHDADIYVGDNIVTSGLDSAFPAGIRIGTVVEIEYAASHLTKIATIEPYVNFSRLEEVFILKKVQEGYIGVLSQQEDESQ